MLNTFNFIATYSFKYSESVKFPLGGNGELKVGQLLFIIAFIIYNKLQLITRYDCYMYSTVVCGNSSVHM